VWSIETSRSGHPGRNVTVVGAVDPRLMLLAAVVLCYPTYRCGAPALVAALITRLRFMVILEPYQQLLAWSTR
jgi:hypothetical protein